MTNAGYSAAQYSIVVQTYKSPIPRGSGFRYSESGYTRQNTGGCGFWNNDADWANDYALPTINNAVRNASHADRASRTSSASSSPSAFNGRRLCENTVGLLEERGLGGWRQRRRVGPDRVDQPDPHRLDLLRLQLLHPGVDPPQLLGSARAAQLRAPGLQRRRAARRHVRAAPTASTAVASRR